MADRIGQQIGNYRLIRLIGQGRISTVYFAEHVHLGRVVAVKILEELPDDGLKAFETEARTIARLKHPHIITIFDFGVIDRTPYIVMDYASNGSLGDRHPHRSQLPLATVVEYIKPIAEALQYMHNENLLHLDVKPGNMFIGRDNQILLSEPDIAFISLSMRTKTLSEDISGTPGYMAPEQIVSKPTRATDQYALGITVYEWLSGRRPFEGSAMALFTQHTQVAPPSLRMQVPSIPSAVENVVMKALAKRPEDRFPGISDFAQALEQAALSDKGYVGTYPTQMNSSETITSVPSHFTTPPTSMASASSIYDTSPTTSTNTQEFEIPTKEGIPLRHNTSRRALITSGLVGLVGLVGAEIFASIWPPQSTTSAPGDTVFVYTGHAGAVLSVAWSPNSNLIASAGADDKIELWNGLTGAVSFVSPSNLPDAVAWSPDGKYIASSDHDVVQVLDGRSGLSLESYSNASPMTGVAWSPDGKHIASASDDWTVRVWDVYNTNFFAFFLFPYFSQTSPVTSMAWSPDSKLIASASQETVQVWNASNGTLLLTYTGHSAPVTSMAWSPDGKHIASASDDWTVRVWNASSGTFLLTYTGHTAPVYSVAWSPDGKHIASCSADQTVQVWDASSGSLLLTYKGHIDSVLSVTWSPDGKYIASGSKDKTVRVWRA